MPPILPKTTAVKLSTVKIRINLTSTPIIRPKLSGPTSLLTSKFTKESHSNLPQPYTIPQPNTTYLSPY